jgi:hypothetical protein
MNDLNGDQSDFNHGPYFCGLVVDHRFHSVLSCMETVLGNAVAIGRSLGPARPHGG